MKVLVTGATGLLGGYLVRTLLEHGYSVRALVRPSSHLGSLSARPVDVVIGDILVPDGRLLEACTGCDMVFHAAAYFAYTGQTDSTLLDTALIGTRNILLACEQADVRRTLVTSSSVVFGYGNASDCLIDETAAVKNGDDVPYVAAKTAQHLAALSIARTIRTEVLMACPTIILGETTAPLGPSNGFVVSYLRDPFHCTFPGGCNIVRAEDVAEGHLMIARTGRANESYLLGSANLTWREIHTEISRLVGLPEPKLELNHTLAYLAASADELRSYFSCETSLSTRTQASMIGRYYWYSHEKAKALGYRPQSGASTLLETVSWLTTSQFVSRETRASLSLSPDIFRYRSSRAKGG
jgi:dihydroflavonol-4-reductase